MNHHPLSEQIVSILCKKTQNTNPNFFRVLVGYHFAKLASMMRCDIMTKDRGTIPVNMYAMNLAPSGQGKGFSMNLMEDSFTGGFRQRFLEETFPEVAETNIEALSQWRTQKLGSKGNIDVERQRVRNEFNDLGELVFSFDSGTTAAVKQMRQKLLIAKAGSMNLEIDEIGSNLLGNVEVLNTYLELYDVGKIKQKLVKNTAENKRSQEIHGRTPTNMMLFGTPVKLLDGDKVEDALMSFMETGYGRRCLFGWIPPTKRQHNLTPDQIYNMQTDVQLEQDIVTISDQITDLADSMMFGKALSMDKDVSLLTIEYRINCEKRADDLGTHQEIQKAELAHRYFKALKLAGAYAFIDGDFEITEDHMYAAIKVVEESGEAFQQILKREKPFVKLAKYIADANTQITQADLAEELPFYKGSQQHLSQLLTRAIAWGYQNNVIVKKSFIDGIEFLEGESIQETDLDKLTVAYSTDITVNYKSDYAPFAQISKLLTTPGIHWVNHHMADGYRKEDNAIQGFNILVIDVDKGNQLNNAQLLLKDYTYAIHTTKRHQQMENGTQHGDRFRLIMPMSHTLKLDAQEFKEFMANIFEWLPLEVDEQTSQRSRKWMSHPGQFYKNEGKVLDVLQFIPRTSKNEQRKKHLVDTQNMSNLERWFLDNTGTGNRSNQLIKFALMLVDSGMDLNTIQSKVSDFNNKLPDKLSETELLSTIMQTVSKRMSNP